MARYNLIEAILDGENVCLVPYLGTGWSYFIEAFHGLIHVYRCGNDACLILSQSIYV
jgi:hypothetical protein